MDDRTRWRWLHSKQVREQGVRIARAANTSTAVYYYQPQPSELDARTANTFFPAATLFCEPEPSQLECPCRGLRLFFLAAAAADTADISA